VVPIPYGEKGPRSKGWQDVTFEQSLEASYQEKICECFLPNGGNLGLIVGPPSADLVDVDIDQDEWVEPFLEANPKLRVTLRRRGKRGCGLMARMDGPYPVGRWDLKLTDGTKFGEWRAGGGHQSVVYGRHPETAADGQPIDYKILVAKRPLRMKFEEIIWPDWVARPLPWEKAAAAGPQSSASPNRQDDIADLDKRIRAYMATMPEAVSGQHGHDATFKVACTLIQGWALSVDEARPYLHAYNALCKPPWSDKELEHKLADAIKEPPARPYGFLRFSEPKNRVTRRNAKSAQTDEESGRTPEENEEFEINWEEISSNSSGGSHSAAARCAFSVRIDFRGLLRLCRHANSGRGLLHYWRNSASNGRAVAAECLDTLGQR
jgi:hypothetical protein